MPADDSVPGLRWLGHSCVLLEGPPAVYLDPWRLEDREGLPPAALVLVTHGHFDHASPESVARIAGPETVVAGPAAALEGLPGRTRPLAAGDRIEVEGVRVTAFEAADRPGGFHPPGTGLGYLVEGAGPRLLHAGDGTRPPPPFDPPPEVIALPVCGGTVMDAAAAARAAAGSGASLALPLHWGDLQGAYRDAERFRDLLAERAPAMRAILRRIERRAR